MFLLKKLMFGLTVNMVDSLYSLYISLVQRNSFNFPYQSAQTINRIVALSGVSCLLQA